MSIWTRSQTPESSGSNSLRCLPPLTIRASSETVIGVVVIPEPLLVSTGRAFGYTSIALDEQGGAMVSWIEQSTGGDKILARPVAANGTPGAVTQVTLGPRKALGYPKILRTGGEIWVAWAGSETPAKVQTVRLK